MAALRIDAAAGHEQLEAGEVCIGGFALIELPFDLPGAVSGIVADHAERARGKRMR